MLDTIDFLKDVGPGAAIFYASQKTGVSCTNIFLAAVDKVRKGPSIPEEQAQINNLASAACLTDNPDVVWQISRVESNFRAYIVNVGGKEILLGNAAVRYLKSNLKKTDNIDIGPLQINWRANGSRYSYSPLDYFNGKFSVEFLSTHILKDYVVSCKKKWINCYHSYDKQRGKDYRDKIVNSGLLLRKILNSFIEKT